LEEEAKVTAISQMPRNVKSKIQLGYNWGLEAYANWTGYMEINNWIANLFTHTQAHFHHDSLGTKIDLDVSYHHILKLYSKIGLLVIFCQ